MQMYDGDKALTKFCKPTRILQLNEEPMENAISYKYLGVSLSWSDHVSKITGKARRLIGE